MATPFQPDGAPASYSDLALQGHDIQEGFLTCDEGQLSSIADAMRLPNQAKVLDNFQMLTPGIWSNPTGIGWEPQRANPFNPPGSGQYSISGGMLTRTPVVGQYVAFALGDVDSGNTTGIYAWDNNNQSVTVVNPSPGIDGECGLVVDASHNVLFTQGFGYNAVPPLPPPNDFDLIINTAIPVDSSTLTGPFAPPAQVAETPHICPADTQYNWQTLCLTADRLTLYALAGDFSIPTNEMLKIDVATGTISNTSSGLGFGDTPTVFLSSDETKVVLTGFPNAAGTHKIRCVVLDASDLSILNATEFVVDVSAFTGWFIDGAALSPDGTKLAVVTGPPNGSVPGALTASIFDTDLYTHTQFTVGTDTGFSGVVTFPKGDSANVLIYLNGSLLTFDLTGTPGTVYALAIPDDQGATQIVTEPNSGLIYGVSYGTLNMILWVYDLNSTTLLTTISGVVPLAGSMPTIVFAT